MRITWDNREEILKQLDKASCVKFAIFCAEQVRHLNDDPAVDAAIDAVKDWLAFPSKENVDAAARTAYVASAVDAAYCTHATAYAAANAANAAYCTYAAVNAADAAYCTYAAAYAARAAYYAANAAAYVEDAIDNIDREQIKQEQVGHLKQLYLETLPEDERNCWLVQATIGV